MSRSWLVLTGLAAASSLGAQQLTVTALAPAPELVVSNFFSGSRVTLPVGVVGGPVALQVGLPGTIQGESATADLAVTPAQHDVRFVVHANTYEPSGAPRTSAASGGVFDVDLTGTAQGVLEVVYTCSSHIGFGTSRLRVDVGADGVQEIDVPGGGTTWRTPVRVNGLLRTRVDLAVSATGRVLVSPADSRIDVTVRFTATDGVTFGPDGDGCGPIAPAPVPVLSGADVPAPGGHVVDLRVDHGIPNGFVALVFSLRETNRAIGLPPGCAFLVEPDIGVFVPADAAGRAALQIGLPSPLPAATIRAQALPFDFAPRAWSSNRLSITPWP